MLLPDINLSSITEDRFPNFSIVFSVSTFISALTLEVTYFLYSTKNARISGITERFLMCWNVV